MLGVRCFLLAHTLVLPRNSDNSYANLSRITVLAKDVLALRGEPSDTRAFRSTCASHEKRVDAVGEVSSSRREGGEAGGAADLLAPLRSGTARVAERLACGPVLAHAKVRVSHDGRIAPTEELLASGDPLPGAVPRA